MAFKDFFDASKSMSSMRLSMFIVTVTVCAALSYLTFTAGIEIAGYLIAALGIGITGKAMQSFSEGKKQDVQDSNEADKTSSEQ